MKCPKCGKKNKNNAACCSYCGADLNVLNSNVPTNPYMTSFQNDPNNPYGTNAKPKAGKKPVIITICAAAAAVITATVIIAVNSGRNASVSISGSVSVSDNDSAAVSTSGSAPVSDNGGVISGLPADTENSTPLQENTDSVTSNAPLMKVNGEEIPILIFDYCEYETDGAKFRMAVISGELDSDLFSVMITFAEEYPKPNSAYKNFYYNKSMNERVFVEAIRKGNAPLYTSTENDDFQDCVVTVGEYSPKGDMELSVSGRCTGASPQIIFDIDGILQFTDFSTLQSKYLELEEKYSETTSAPAQNSYEQ